MIETNFAANSDTRHNLPTVLGDDAAEIFDRDSRASSVAHRGGLLRVRHGRQPRQALRVHLDVVVGQHDQRLIGERHRTRQASEARPELGRRVTSKDQRQPPRLTPRHAVRAHPRQGDAEAGAPVVLKRRAVLLDEIEERQDSG